MALPTALVVSGQSSPHAAARGVCEAGPHVTVDLYTDVEFSGTHDVFYLCDDNPSIRLGSTAQGNNTSSWHAQWVNGEKRAVCLYNFVDGTDGHKAMLSRLANPQINSVYLQDDRNLHDENVDGGSANSGDRADTIDFC
ncbi:hypothetical protein [Nocardia brasiliensis]